MNKTYLIVFCSSIILNVSLIKHAILPKYRTHLEHDLTLEFKYNLLNFKLNKGHSYFRILYGSKGVAMEFSRKM